MNHPQLDNFVALADALVKENFARNWSDENRQKYPDFPIPEITVELGKRYARLVKGERKPVSGEATEARSAFCFVDLVTGDILKAAGWKAPAKGKRGSVFDPDGGLSAITPYGACSLR